MISLSVASMPHREPCLRDWLAWAVFEPVDHIRIYLDSYEVVPEWLADAIRYDRRVEVRASVPAGDDPRMRALGKLAWAAEEGYHLTTDDDIIYPPGYVQYTLDRLESLGRAVVTHHGSLVTPEYTAHYARGGRRPLVYHKARFQCRVHLPGTGCMAFKAPDVDLRPERFERTVGIDSIVGVLMKADDVPVYVLASEANKLLPNSKARGPSLVGSSILSDGSEYDTSALHTETVLSNAPWPELNPNVRLTALRNIARAVTGTKDRINRGETFEIDYFTAAHLKHIRYAA